MAGGYPRWWPLETQGTALSATAIRRPRPTKRIMLAFFDRYFDRLFALLAAGTKETQERTAARQRQGE